jgi:hypothetical protein
MCSMAWNLWCHFCSTAAWTTLEPHRQNHGAATRSVPYNFAILLPHASACSDSVQVTIKATVSATLIAILTSPSYF